MASLAFTTWGKACSFILTLRSGPTSNKNSHCHCRSCRNTCYLNSSIQCLSHTPILRDYFTSKAYLRDINTTNPLGHEGRLAQAFAVLVHNLWKKYDKGNAPPSTPGNMSSSLPLDAPSLTPKSFKVAMGKFNESFAGNEQHDAQELLAFLLSGLSEDLNRIVKKPYIEAPDSDGRPDEELADIWWTNHFQRELSIIEALFTGQYKSTSTCKTCKYESARFEPFLYLQIPLPEDDQVNVQCILYPINTEDEIMKYSVRVRHDGTVKDVMLNLARLIYEDKYDSIEIARTEVVESIEMERNDFGFSNGKDSPRHKLYSEMVESMAVVDMGESCIRKIIPVSISRFAIFFFPHFPPLPCNRTSIHGHSPSSRQMNLARFRCCMFMKFNLIPRRRPKQVI